MMMFSIPLNVLGFVAAYINSTPLALARPLITVTIRRPHDTDRSGWWPLLMSVPFAGWAVLVFMLQPGTDRCF